MKIFDAHCDTGYKLWKKGISLYKNKGHCDIERMLKFGAFSQFFAVCAKTFSEADAIIDKFYEEVRLNEPYIQICKSYNDILEAEKQHKIAAFLTLEGAAPLKGNIENLYYFYEKGVRLITLTWNDKNELGCGSFRALEHQETERGLTPFGIEVVHKMNELGIIIDVSHLSDEGFHDVLEYSAKPFMASHSNARGICNNARNLTDDMIVKIAERKGFIGINLNPPFITMYETANIDKLMLHIEHIAALAGENRIGLGCDFDGIDSTPEDIKDVSDIYKIINRLAQLNYSPGSIDNFSYKNLMDFVKNYAITLKKRTKEISE